MTEYKIFLDNNDYQINKICFKFMSNYILKNLIYLFIKGNKILDSLIF